MSTALANPVEMIRRGAPRLIHNDKELAEYTRALFDLTAKANPSREGEEAIELMTLLVERYESQRFPVPDAEPVDVLRFLLESNRLSQRDIAMELGGEATVSLVLSGKRQLNRDHIARLSRKFGVSPAVFFGSTERHQEGKLGVFRAASKRGVTSRDVDPKVVSRAGKKNALLRKGA